MTMENSDRTLTTDKEARTLTALWQNGGRCAKSRSVFQINFVANLKVSALKSASSPSAKKLKN